MAHKALREVNDEKEAIISDINNHRNLSYSLEMNKEDLQRHASQVEHDNKYLKQQMKDI